MRRIKLEHKSAPNIPQPPAKLPRLSTTNQPHTSRHEPNQITPQVSPKNPLQPKTKDPKDNPPPASLPIQIFSGSIPQILQASKSALPFNVLFETFGKIISISQGKFQCEQIVLLRSVEGTGPVIQGVFHEIDLSLNASCRRNQLVRCVGRFSSQGRFQIIKMGPTSQGFIDSMNRLFSFSSFSMLRK